MYRLRGPRVESTLTGQIIHILIIIVASTKIAIQPKTSKQQSSFSGEPRVRLLLLESCRY
uniref:Uncharacterized protein n=1 Tax=Rhizophora mucronata TaxID=61149 RepID=A0A2P2K4I5_RHIMU